MKMGKFQCLIFASFVWLSNCQTITLFDFQQEDSKSECTFGLLSYIDTIVFKCTVDYSHDTQAKHAIFQTKGRFDNRFVFLDDCNIQDTCTSSKYTKGSHVGRYIINMTIIVEARQYLSHAQLRGKLYTSDGKEIMSSERRIPYISDVADANVTLIVNGHTISTTQECRKNILRGELHIVFLCESQVSPCLIEISTDDSNETSQGEGYATWNKLYPSQSEVNVLIKYDVCNLRGKCQSLSCKFDIDNKSTTKEISCNDNEVPLSLVSALAAVLICVLIFQFKKKILRLFSKSDPQETVSKKQSSKNTSDSDAHALLGEMNGQETSIDTEMESTRKRHIDTGDTYEASTAPEPQNLKTDFTSCQKKEKHERFIPIDKFNKDDLPHKYGTTDLFDLVKCIAELTVKVTVHFISYQRPMFYPGTDNIYPFHEKKGNISCQVRNRISEKCNTNGKWTDMPLL